MPHLPIRPRTPIGFHQLSFGGKAALTPTAATTDLGASPSPDSTHLNIDEIAFPRVYQDAWGPDAGLTCRSDIERARVYLMRMARLMTANMPIATALRGIAADPSHGTIAALVSAIQMQLFTDGHGIPRHDSFAATPLLQCVRFLLIKGRIPHLAVSERARDISDFFFDPTLARNVEPVPEDRIVLPYPAAPLKVCIVGGGPTALASAISLAEKGGSHVEVHMYERRWVRKARSDGSTYVDYPATARRRDQVVTLQDSVTSLLSPASYEALFAGQPERVWPASANIQIRKVEDRLLARCQASEFQDRIHLHCRAMTQDTLAEGVAGDFHVLLGADGAASWVRKNYFQGYEKERGKSFALGLAFDRPAGLPWSQPLNVFLTLGQTRYLLNASNYDGRGYLNMQLTEAEWDKMVNKAGDFVTFGNPGCLRAADGTIPAGFTENQVFLPSENRESALWQSISDGLKLFGFKESEVINVVRIPIVVQAVREGVQQLSTKNLANIRRPHGVVAVAGDAAMTVHFWPGRGLNSGIKAGLALGDELVHALRTGKFVGLPSDALGEYNDFILKLQDREHDKRSIPILNQSGTPEMLGWLMGKAHAVPDEVAVEWLVGAMTQIASRLERRPDWAYAPVTNVEPQLRIVLRQLTSVTLREMAVSFPWPTREMGGAEVLPLRSMKTDEKQRWFEQLWGLLQRDEAPVAAVAGDGSRLQVSNHGVSKGRFEAPSPRPKSSGPQASAASTSLTDGSGGTGLRRSNATVRGRGEEPGPRKKPTLTQNPRIGSARRALPKGEDTSDFGLTRMLSVKKPSDAVLSDALSLALFRVDED